MKMPFANSIYGLTGMVCLVCCFGVMEQLHGQQLLPKSADTRPAVTGTPGQMLTPVAPAVVGKSDATSLPPVISVTELLAADGPENTRIPVDIDSGTPQSNAGPVEDRIPDQAPAERTGPVSPDRSLPVLVPLPRPAAMPEPADAGVYGKNFPTDAGTRIARFVQENQQEQGQAEFESTSVLANRQDRQEVYTPGAFQNPPHSDSSINSRPVITGNPGTGSANSRLRAFDNARQLESHNAPLSQPYSAWSPGVSTTPGFANSPSPVINQPSYGEPQYLPGAYSIPGNITRPRPDYIGQPGQFGGQQWVESSPGQEYEIIDSYSDELSSTDAYSPGSLADTFGCCGFIREASGYFITDALFWNRADGDFRTGNFTFPDNFGWIGGSRMTLGRRRDCTRGAEISFMGFHPWLSETTETSPGGQLTGAIFGSVGGFFDSTFSAFRNSTFLDQVQKSDLYSLEINQTWWGSDVAKAFLGMRFIYFDDQYRMSSANIFNQVGVHTIDTTNNMFGIHVGSEVLYDIGYRLSFSFSGKLGGYANFWEGRTVLFNNNVIWINATRRDTDFGASAEAGVFARYKLGPRSRFRAGYEVLGLARAYDVESNFSTVVLPTSGQNYNHGGAFFHGASFGIEIWR